MIGERGGDKIAASKKKGMWMGGQPPLGYDVRDRKPVVNQAEADVRPPHLHLATWNSSRSSHFRRRSLQPGSGASGGSGPMAMPTATKILGRGALYQMLQNRIYRGEIAHKGSAYPGQHPAIVDQDLWDRVQATLTETASSG